jgi:predicted metal-dependent hydrolase
MSSRAGCSARRARVRGALRPLRRAPRRAVTRLSLSSAKTRWGSANAGGAIRLHWRLVQYPLATIDYVVAHELAHLREMNHGPRFWAVVGSVVPDYRAARRPARQRAARRLGLIASPAIEGPPP